MMIHRSMFGQHLTIQKWGSVFITTSLLVAFFGAFIWSINGDWVYSAQSQSPDIWEFVPSSGNVVGQTFTAYEAGLKAIEVKMNFLGDTPSELLTLHIHTNDAARTRVATATAYPQTGHHWVRFTFQALPTSRLNDYIFYIESQLSQTINLYTAPADTYLDGAAYLNNAPQNRQLVFNLIYQRTWMLWDTIQRLSKAVPTIFVILLLLLSPGGALLVWLWPNRDLDRYGSIIVAMGLSIACLPLMLLIAYQLNIQLTAGVIWGIIVLSIVAWGIGIRNHNFSSLSIKRRISFEEAGLYTTLCLLTLAVILSRFWVIRNLTIPLWGDSYQHTLISQLMLNHGGLFQSWQPYSFSSSFTYHFGFHSFVMIMAMLTGKTSPEAVILTGQLMNTLAVLALYPLGYKLGDKRAWAGIGAVFIAGFMFTMPAFYVNWGRYTQLTGQVILPIAAILTFALFQHRSWKSLVLAVLVSAGLSLTHYRITIIFGLLIVAWLSIDLMRSSQKWLRFRQYFGWGLAYGIATVLILMPWILNLQQGNIATIGSRVAAKTVETSLNLSTYLANISDIFSFVPTVIFWLAGLALLVGLRQYFIAMLIITIWTVLVVFSGIPHRVSQMGNGLISAFAVKILLYIPFSLLIGLLIGEVNTQILKVKKQWLKLLPTGIAVLVILLSVPGQLAVVEKQNHAFVTRADERAAQWVKTHTSPESFFLVDGFAAFYGSAVVGTDGGWWLPFLAERKTSMPPLTYKFENVGDQQAYQLVDDIVEFGQTQDIASQTGADFLQAQGITHIYVAQRQSRFRGGSRPMLIAENLHNNPRYIPIYHEDRVWIFEIDQGQ